MDIPVFISPNETTLRQLLNFGINDHHDLLEDILKEAQQ